VVSYRAVILWYFQRLIYTCPESLESASVSRKVLFFIAPVHNLSIQMSTGVFHMRRVGSLATWQMLLFIYVVWSDRFWSDNEMLLLKLAWTSAATCKIESAESHAARRKAIAHMILSKVLLSTLYECVVSFAIVAYLENSRFKRTACLHQIWLQSGENATGSF
jgi:uncharacterized membrane protein